MKDLGITEDDLIEVITKDTEDGGLVIQYVFSDEANSIIRAYCERMGIRWEDLAKSFLLGRPHPTPHKK